jgi:indolepyruvate ferredoxin oxidoreductase, beta subunit
MKKQIVIAGTGGQGVLFVTRIIVEAAFLSGHPVISSETHGMAMRGGSVISQIKIGNYLSPAIEQGQADVLLGLTRQEAEAYSFYLKPSGKRVVNDRTGDKDSIDADSQARKMGLPRSGNMFYMGYAAQKANLGLKPDKYMEAITNLSPAKFKDQNLAAFKAGMKMKE